MKVNDIRKLAKEIRTGKCSLSHDEIIEVLTEIDEYVGGEAARAWTDRTKSAINSDLKDIRGYADDVKPESEDEKIETTEEIVRKNFKTVVSEMDGKKHPILEAVRWFAVVFADDGYEKAKCIKGMLRRRGYKIVDNNLGFWVTNDDGTRVIATVDEKDGIVTGFNIV